jgi:hypothetical protein
MANELGRGRIDQFYRARDVEIEDTTFTACGHGTPSGALGILFAMLTPRVLWLGPASSISFGESSARMKIKGSRLSFSTNSSSFGSKISLVATYPSMSTERAPYPPS